MKPRAVQTLLRLYPARWRAQYGAEFAELLMQRPLRFAEVVNVVMNAGWQQLRMQEPWVLVAVPMLLRLAVYLGMLFATPASTPPGGKPTVWYIAIFFAVGFWTVCRSGHGGGAAAMKLSMLLTVPLFGAGLFLLWRSVAFLSRTGPYWMDADPVRIFMVVPVLQIPYAGLIGWCGGMAGHLARRIPTSR